MKKYKIAVGGLHIESSTFTKYISSKKDFVLKDGKDLYDKYSWVKKYEDKVDLLPIYHGRALPGGKVSRVFFNNWLKKFEDILNYTISKEKIDGFLLDIHGAMSVEGIEDAEGYIAKKLRNLLGKDVLISATMDLHGNVSDLLFESCDLLTCYRTAPHIDVEETKIRAFVNMLNVLENKSKIYRSKVDIPMLLPGEKTSTEVSPGKDIYNSIEEIISKNSLIDLSIWMGFPWADEERCHAVTVCIGTDKEKVEKCAKDVANEMWENKDNFKFVGPTDTIENALITALKSNKIPFFISDTGDNPGAGGSGDTNIVLRELLKINKINEVKKNILLASIVDKESICQIYKHDISEDLSIDLGGKIDQDFGKPINITVNIVNKFTDSLGGKCALIRHNNISIIITEKRIQYGSLEKFNNAGIESFSEFEIIIVKIGYLEPDLNKGAKGWVMALTDGSVCQDINKLKFYKLKRPIFPMDEDFYYNPVIKTISN